MICQPNCKSLALLMIGLTSKNKLECSHSQYNYFNNFKIITKGLNSEQVKVVVDQYHIYLLSSGRISIAGLNDGNVAYVANAFHQATKNSNI